MEVNHQCELAAVLGMFSRFLGSGLLLCTSFDVFQ